MVESLEKAFAEIAKLPDAQQEQLALWILDELDEVKWSKLFAESQTQLDTLSKKALSEHRVGKTRNLKLLE